MPARLLLLRQVMIIGHLLSVDWLLLHICNEILEAFSGQRNVTSVQA